MVMRTLNSCSVFQLSISYWPNMHTNPKESVSLESKTFNFSSHASETSTNMHLRHAELWATMVEIGAVIEGHLST